MNVHVNDATASELMALMQKYEAQGHLKGFSYEHLMQCFLPDFERGRVVWRERPRCHFKTAAAHKGFNKRFAYKEAFTSPTPEGYLRTSLDGKHLYAHRVLFFLSETWCPPVLDHINRNNQDNRLSNLRPATPLENARNRSVYRAGGVG